MTILQDFDRWLMLSYSSDTTRHSYHCAINNLFNKYTKEYGKEPELNQHLMDFLRGQLNQKTNCFYRSCTKAFYDFATESNKQLVLKFEKNRSRGQTKIGYSKYDFFTSEQVDNLIAEGSNYISLIADIIKHTGLRRHEILTLERSGIDFKECTLEGVGKNNVLYKLPIPKRVALRMKVWIESEAPNPDLPFMPMKDGVEYKQPDNRLHRLYVNECKRLNIKTADGKDPHIHAQRHQFGRNLRDQGLDIIQIKNAMRHRNIEVTKIYVDDTPEETEKAVRGTFK